MVVEHALENHLCAIFKKQIIGKWSTIGPQGTSNHYIILHQSQIHPIQAHWGFAKGQSGSKYRKKIAVNNGKIVVTTAWGDIQTTPGLNSTLEY